MKQHLRQAVNWLFTLQGKFIITASVCSILFTTAGGLIIISRDAALYRQNIVNQGKVISEISRLMLTNVMVYNELGMMDDHDLKDFLDYFIIQSMQQDKRIRHVAIIDTAGKIIASSDTTRYGEMSIDQDSLAVLKHLEIIVSEQRFADEPALNITVPLNINSKSWGGLRIVLSTRDVDLAIAARRQEIFFIASLFFALYLLTPVASSKTSLLSSGLELMTRSILPCSTKEYDSAPIPVPISISLISLRRTGLLFIRYSLSPER